MNPGGCFLFPVESTEQHDSEANNSYNRQHLLSPYYTHTKQCVKRFSWIISLNPPNNFKR
jgi:hypothetical protein